jgi:hypothetical protein
LGVVKTKRQEKASATCCGSLCSQAQHISYLDTHGPHDPHDPRRFAFLHFFTHPVLVFENVLADSQTTKPNQTTKTMLNVNVNVDLFITNQMRTHKANSLSQAASFFNSIKATLPQRRDETTKAKVVRFVGFGARADPVAMLDAAERAFLELGIGEADNVIITFDGDFYSCDSFTSVLVALRYRNPNTTRIVAIRGTHPDQHAKFYDSWVGIPIYLLEISDELREAALKKVTELIGPDSSASTETRVTDEKQLKNTMHGFFNLTTVPADAVVFLGGGITCGNEAKAATELIRTDPTLLPPAWKVCLLDRAGKEVTDPRENCDEYLEVFKADREAAEAKKKAKEQDEEGDMADLAFDANDNDVVTL